MASAMNAKIMETPPVENRSRSDIACPLAAVIFDAPGNGRVQRESRIAAQIQNRPTWLSAACSWVPGALGLSPFLTRLSMPSRGVNASAVPAFLNRSKRPDAVAGGIKSRAGATFDSPGGSG